jgi:hypothetical protein
MQPAGGPRHCFVAEAVAELLPALALETPPADQSTSAEPKPLAIALGAKSQDRRDAAHDRCAPFAFTPGTGDDATVFAQGVTTRVSVDAS